MAKAISGHGAPKSGMAMAIVVIPMALPLSAMCMICIHTHEQFLQ